MAQENLKSMTFKKGEILDILLLSTVPDYEPLFDRYKKTAFPVAFDYSYQLQPGFDITDYTLGNHLPQSIVFGKWSSLENRVGFLENIVKRVPDFHDQRRGLFEYFGLTYFVMSEDLSFSINKEKHNVTTCFWPNENEQFERFYVQWKKEVVEFGGKFVLELQDGSSPIGYYYNPDLLCIVQWENPADFETFAKEHPLSYYRGLKNVHQFVFE